MRKIQRFFKLQKFEIAIYSSSVPETKTLTIRSSSGPPRKSCIVYCRGWKTSSTKIFSDKKIT